MPLPEYPLETTSQKGDNDLREPRGPLLEQWRLSSR
jgi:hypothetical protein